MPAGSAASADSNRVGHPKEHYAEDSPMDGSHLNRPDCGRPDFGPMARRLVSISFCDGGDAGGAGVYRAARVAGRRSPTALLAKLFVGNRTRGDQLDSADWRAIWEKHRSLAWDCRSI